MMKKFTLSLLKLSQFYPFHTTLNSDPAHLALKKAIKTANNCLRGVTD